MVGLIAPDDLMYDSAPGDRDLAYHALGRAALDSIRLALLAAQKDSPKRILDLPCGHGRVLRILAAEYPGSEIVACDIDRRAVDFCAEALGARPLYGTEHPGEMKIEEPFDLIWCGSLLTHLDLAGWEEFLDFFERVLAPGGLLVLTTSGRSIAAKLRDPATGGFWMSDPARRNAIVAGYEETGFGFAEYPTSPEERAVHSLPASYGISLSHPARVCTVLADRPRLQLVTLMENRWGAQDVIGAIRVDAVEEGRTGLRGVLGGIRRPRPELYRP